MERGDLLLGVAKDQRRRTPVLTRSIVILDRLLAGRLQPIPNRVDVRAIERSSRGLLGEGFRHEQTSGPRSDPVLLSPPCTDLEEALG